MALSAEQKRRNRVALATGRTPPHKTDALSTAATLAAISPTAAPNDAPAGGTGDAAGAWDTSGHRDTAITAINTNIDRIAELVAYAGTLKTAIDKMIVRIAEIEDALQEHNLLT